MERDLKLEQDLGEAIRKTIDETPLNGTMTIKFSTTADTDKKEEFKENLLKSMEQIVIMWHRPDIKVQVVEFGKEDLN